MNMVTCPKCKMRVLPKEDGTCPSCQAVISPSKIARTSKSALVKPEKASLPLKQKSSAGTKSISSKTVADKRGGSQSQIKTKDDQQTPEHLPTKLESRYTFAMNKTIDYIFVLVVVLLIGDWIIEHKINIDVILKFGLLGAALLFILLMLIWKPKKE
jgi:hypothetical protein